MCVASMGRSTKEDRRKTEGSKKEVRRNRPKEDRTKSLVILSKVIDEYADVKDP